MGNETEATRSAQIVARKPDAGSPAARIFRRQSTLSPERRYARYRILNEQSLLDTIQKCGIGAAADHVVLGDSLRALSAIPSDTVRCIVTSPPYWNVVDYGVTEQYGQTDYEQYLHQLLGVWRECYRVLAPNGKLCINVPIMPIAKAVIGDQHTRHLKNLSCDIEHSIISEISGFNRFSLYVWQKQTTEKMFGSYPYPPNLYEQNTIEFINVLVKDGKPDILAKEIKEASRISEKEWMNLTKQIWRLYPEDVKRVQHPAPFPLSLPSRLIAMYTFGKTMGKDPPFEGDIVLDPFAGTGTTCVAAKELGRRYLGVDVVPEFCIAAAERLETTIYTGRVRLDEYGNAERTAIPKSQIGLELPAER